MIVVRRGDLSFTWEQGRTVEIAHADAPVPLPFACTFIPGGWVTREMVEQAAQRWIDAQPDGRDG